MAFSVYGKEPTISWDRSGKASALATTPLLLSATTAVWRTFSNKYGYAFETNDLGPADHIQPKITFYAHPNQAAGTVPFYRFRRADKNKLEYFYAQCKSCYDGNGWTLDVKGDANSNDKGVAFYVYSDATTPGSVPLYLYHDSHSHYFLTTNQSEATGMTLDGTWAYVFDSTIPTTPSNLVIGFNGLTLDWQDNSSNETGFRIERDDNDWTEVGTVGANVTHYDTGFNVGHDGSWSCVSYRVRAVNAAGTSAYAVGNYGSCHGDVNP